MEVNSYLLVNGTEIIKFKAKDSAIVASPLCLGNISKDWSTDNMKKTGLTGYVYDVTIDDIKNIHNYLMKKMILCKWKCLVLLKKCLF